MIYADVLIKKKKELESSVQYTNERIHQIDTNLTFKKQINTNLTFTKNSDLFNATVLEDGSIKIHGLILRDNVSEFTAWLSKMYAEVKHEDVD